MWLTKKAYRVIGLFSDVDLVENSGDFKLFSRKALDHILSLPEHDPYMRGLAVWIGFQQSYLLYERDPRYDGESKFGLLNSLNPYKEFIRGITSFSEFPLYFALISGLLATAMSIGLIVYMVVTKFLGMNIPGWTAIMVAILFFGGSILSTVGILGVYVGKIFSQSKGRPMYIVENEIGFKVDDR